MKIHSYEDLETYLQNWINFHGEGNYDFNGALHLTRALLRNMKKHAIDSDFDELNEIFQPDERDVLKLMCRKLS